MDEVQRSRRKIEKLKPIARKRHNYIFLFISILLGILSLYLFIKFPPEHMFQVSNFMIPVIPIFLASLAGFIYFLTTFIFIQKTQAVILSILITTLLITRLLGFTHFIFLIMFLVIFGVVEVFVFKQK